MNSHAWVIAAASRTARERVSTAGSWPTRSRQTRHRGALPRWRRRRRCESRPRRPRAWISSAGSGAVDDEVAARGARAARARKRWRTASWKSSASDSSRSCTSPRRARPTSAETSRTTVRSGTSAADRPLLQVVDLVGAEVAPGALVGDRAVGVAVGDDDGAPVAAPVRMSWSTWCALSAAKSRASARGETWSPCRTSSRICGAERRPPGLAGHDDLAARRLAALGEQAHLGRLARAVAALEADEESLCASRARA